MNDRSPKSKRRTLPASPSATSSPELAGWSYALRLAGWPDERPVWTGSCPCQPFSAAGKHGGVDDERHLWPAFFDLIRERSPDVVFGEQVASKDGLGWFDLVHTDMEGAGYAIGAIDSCAAGFGAPHIRQRLYWVADAHGRDASAEGLQRSGQHGQLAQNCGAGEARGASPTHRVWGSPDLLFCRDGKWRPVEPGTFPLAHGAPARVGRLRGYGNALVAPQAQAFIESYLDLT